MDAIDATECPPEDVVARVCRLEEIEAERSKRDRRLAREADLVMHKASGMVCGVVLGIWLSAIIVIASRAGKAAAS